MATQALREYLQEYGVSLDDEEILALTDRIIGTTLSDEEIMSELGYDGYDFSDLTIESCEGLYSLVDRCRACERWTDTDVLVFEYCPRCRVRA